MIAETRNGVNHSDFDRMAGPSIDGTNGGPAASAPPSTTGENGTPAAAVPPSTYGENGTTAAEAPPSTNESNGRDEHGRFAKGNAGGPGNPFARQTAALRRALCQTVSAEDVQAVALRLIEQAKAGDVAAARLLFSYAIGRPADVVDPDLLDVQEWQIHRKMAVPFTEVDGMVRDVPTDFACRLAQGWLPQHSMIMGQEATQVLNGETPAQMKKKRRAERRRARSRAASGTQHSAIDNDVPAYVRRMREDWPPQR